MNIRKSISLDEKLWNLIDKRRGIISRSAFINKFLVGALKGRKSK